MEIAKELEPWKAEFEAAAACGDIEKCREIVERAGLTWLDPELPEKYKCDARC
jgi:hypothetical protein